MAITLSNRAIAYHEAAHAVAYHFYPLAGKTRRIVVGKDRLAKFNAGKHPVNQAWGLHTRGKTLPAIVGRSVDREQIHHEGVSWLSGYTADWLRAGSGRGSPLRVDPLADPKQQKHADGSDDVSRCWCLLSNADPLDTCAVARRIRDTHDLGGEHENLAAAEEDGRRAVESYTAQRLEQFDALWCETREFVSEKWAHIQAVAEAVLRKGVLEADEITERIERIEERLQSYPPQILAILDRQRA
jgi:hypothetical protein